MRQYFYTDGNKRFGPYTIDDLQHHNITPETLVWYDGMADWQPARTMYELQDIVKQAPPPISPTTRNNYNSQQTNHRPNIPPKTWLVESILVTLFCCLPFGIIGIINASKVESRFYAGDIQDAEKCSRDAKKWTVLSFWIGLAAGLIYFIAVFALGFSDALY